MKSLTNLLDATFRLDGRWLLAGIVSLYFTLLLLSHLVLGHYSYAWTYLGVQVIPSFVDLNILLCAFDAMREGLNPYEYSCGDIGVYYNYPIIWKLFSYLPFLNPQNTIVIGCIQLVLFLAVFFLFIRKIPASESLYYAAFLISPACMLGLERGNSDILIFVMITTSLLLFNKKIASFIILIFAACLKIFPIAAFGMHLFSKDIKWKWLLLGILIFSIYLLFQFSNIAQVISITPKPSTVLCFGLDDIPQQLHLHFHLSLGFSRILEYTTILGLLVYLFPRVSKPLLFSTERKELSFYAGLSIYLVCYLVIQYNFEYRLIFLLLALPGLWENRTSPFILILLLILLINFWEHFIDLVLQHILHFSHFLFINQLLHLVVCSMIMAMLGHRIIAKMPRLARLF